MEAEPEAVQPAVPDRARHDDGASPLVVDAASSLTRPRQPGRHLERVPTEPGQPTAPTFQVSSDGAVHATDPLAHETAETVLSIVQLAEAASRTLGAGPTTAVELLGAPVMTASVHHGPDGVSVVGHVEDVETDIGSSRRHRVPSPDGRRLESGSDLQLVRDVPGVVGWFVVDGAGSVLVRDVPDDIRDDVLTDVGRRCDAALQAGILPLPASDQVILRYERLAAFALRAGDNLLVVLAEPDTRTVLARTAMRVAAAAAASAAVSPAGSGPSDPWPRPAPASPRADRPRRPRRIWG